MQQIIYFVGKPYPLPEAIDTCKKAGYGIGLLEDITIPSKKTENYDVVIPVNFESRQSIHESLAFHPLVSPAGLICTYENYIVAKSIISEQYGLAAQTESSARECTDKHLMREAFRNFAPDLTPRHMLLHSDEDIRAAVSSLRFPVILKPTNLVKSMLIMKCSDEQELYKNYTYAKQRIAELYRQYQIHDREPNIIVEEFITGKTCSIAAFVDEEGVPHFCDGIVALTNAQDLHLDDNFLYCRVLPGEFDQKLTDKLFDAATRGIQALHMSSTPAHVELIYNDQDIKIIEIGARIGGYRPRMYEYSYGLNLIAQEMKLALGNVPQVSGELKAYSAVFELFPEKEGLFSGIGGAQNIDLYTSFKVKATSGERVGPAKNGYKACAIVFIVDDNREQFEKRCKEVEKLNVELKT